MKRFPLLFQFRDLIAGNKFLAGVEMNGRALLVDEDDGVWIYGVNPGGMAAAGEDKSEALNAFRKAYQVVLNDIVASAASFEEFEAEVTRFFAQESDADEWAEAVEQVRAEGKSVDWVHSEDADSPRGVLVVKLPHEALDPSKNRDPLAEELRLAA